MADEEKKANKDEHRDWVKEEFDEGDREKKKAFGFEKKIVNKVDLRKKPALRGKFTHGTRGKPTHGPRGNQG